MSVASTANHSSFAFEVLTWLCRHPAGAGRLGQLCGVLVPPNRRFVSNYIPRERNRILQLCTNDTARTVFSSKASR